MKECGMPFMDEITRTINEDMKKNLMKINNDVLRRKQDEVKHLESLIARTDYIKELKDNIKKRKEGIITNDDYEALFEYVFESLDDISLSKYEKLWKILFDYCRDNYKSRKPELTEIILKDMFDVMSHLENKWNEIYKGE